MTVVAAYYGGWKSPPEPIVTWQGSSPWGVDASDNVFMGNFPERFPDYGAVDEDQQWVIDRHLSDAAAAGVGVFAVNWYRDDFLSYAADRIAASGVAPGVKFCIQWSNHYTSMSATAAQRPYIFEGVRRAALRMSSPRYWTRSGKPVLILFSAVHLDDAIRVATGQPVAYTPSLAERNALIADIRSVVGNVLDGDASGGISGSTVSSSINPGPYLVLMTGDGGWAQVSGVDAMTSYNTQKGQFADGLRFARSYDELATATRQSWGSGNKLAAANNKKHWPCVMSGWDKRPWGGTVEDPLHDNCLPDGSQLLAHCLDARAAAQIDTAEKTVFVYAWNEFGEGGFVQPTAGYADSRLWAIESLSSTQPI